MSSVPFEGQPKRKRQSSGYETSQEDESDNSAYRDRVEARNKAEENERRARQFEEVMSEIRLEKVPDFASKRRQQIETESDSTNGDRRTTPELIKCLVQENPYRGSSNIIFVIEFIDDMKWLLKVPWKAFEYFEPVDAHILESEAQTIRFIKSKTKIPLPAVYAYDNSFNNDINSPYIMMEMLSGQVLLDAWFSTTVTPEQLEERRARTLKDLASYMSQLDKLRFDKGGKLLFDKDGKQCGIGQMPFTNDEEEEVYMIGPFSDPDGYISRKMKQEVPVDNFGKSMEHLLSLFIHWIPKGPDPKFALCHEDLGIRNVLVAPDGSVTGIIDWQGISVKPRCVGTFPLWLMHHWDAGKLIHPTDRDQNTPEIFRYRAMYMRFMTQCAAAEDASSSDTINMLKLCPLATCIAGAALNMRPEFPGSISGRDYLQKIVREIVEVAANDPRTPKEATDITVPLVEFLSGKEKNPHKTTYALSRGLGARIENGTISDDEMGWLRKGFVAVCDREIWRGT